MCALAALCAVTLGLFAHVVRITDVDHSLAVDSVVLDTGNGTNTTLARQRPYIHPVLKRARQQHSAALSRQHTRQQPQLRPTQASQPASPIAEPATQASGAAGKRSSQRSASSLRKPVTGQPLASRPSQPLKPAPLSIQSFRFSFTDQHATAFTWERTPNVHRGWQGPLFKDLNGTLARQWQATRGTTLCTALTKLPLLLLLHGQAMDTWITLMYDSLSHTLTLTE